VAAIFSPIKADFPLMNGREYNVNEEIRESKWGSAGDGRDQETGLPTSSGDLCETSCESAAVSPAANRAPDTRACAETASHRAQAWL
jgi:hypothetical protein